MWRARSPAETRAGTRRPSPMMYATVGMRRNAALAAQLNSIVPAKTTDTFSTAGMPVASIANCSQTMKR